MDARGSIIMMPVASHRAPTCPAVSERAYTGMKPSRPDISSTSVQRYHTDIAEYRNKTITKTLGSPYLGCYALAVVIFSLGIFRDLVYVPQTRNDRSDSRTAADSARYERALRAQPHLAILSQPPVQALAYALIALGQLFVITSIYALGITGTYLGDYFGILMKARVTGFPFNVLNDPMYVGSTLAFVGTALLYRSVAGLGISALVWVVYSIALRFEG